MQESDLAPFESVILEVAKTAAKRGGEIVARYFREGVTIRNKQTYNLVSDADVESEQAIVACIREAFPDHAILAEEGFSEVIEAEHLWVIDPLDGTNNFAHGIPHFAVSIAYYQNGQAVCGVVYQPVKEEWFTTVRGQGAYYNEEKVSVSEATALNQTLIGVGFYYDRGSMMESTLAAIRDFFFQEIHGIRRFGTAAIDLCQVGMGWFGGFFEYELSAWDFAAGRLFVEEAGGTITDGKGDPLPLKKTSVLASNTKLHEAMLKIVAEHHP